MPSKFAGNIGKHWPLARIWLLLVVAFSMVSAAACYFAYIGAVERYQYNLQTELLSLAKLFAAQVDPEKHERLIDEAQMETQDYKDIEAELAKSKDQVPHIRFVYTLRQVNDKLYFIVDPTPAGDHDKDGVDDKSYLMEEYEDASPIMLDTFKTSSPQYETEVYTDKWGSFLSAYAPIRNSSGRLVSVMGVDVDAKEILAQQSRLKTIFTIALLIAFGLSCLIAFYITTQLAKYIDRAEISRVSRVVRMTTRATMLQVILLMIVVTSTSISLFGVLSSKGDERSLKGILSTLATISDSRQILENELASEAPSLHELQNVQYRLDATSFIKTRESLSTAIEAIKQKDPTWREKIRRACSALNDKQAEIAFMHQETIEIMTARRDSMFLTYIIAALLSLGSLVLVRYATSQQEKMMIVAHLANTERADKETIVENLPVGLFVFQNASCVFGNRAFDSLIGNTNDADATDAFIKALHPDDRERVLATVFNAEATSESYEIEFRIILETGETLYVEAKGVPVLNEDGTVRHLLSFSNDITTRVLAQKELADKNHEIQSANEKLKRALNEQKDNFEAMVQAWVKAVEAKDVYTAGHSERVMKYSLKIGKRLGLSQQEMHILEMGTLIHDIGKIGIPDEVLTKPSGLTNEEFDLIKKHPEMGYQMIAQIPMFRECAPIVLWHHEKLDGSGYPDGLEGDEIPLLVRISAVSDMFDAMTSTRSYRACMTAERALEELLKDVEKGKVDGKIVQVLADIVNEEGVLWTQDLPQAA